jgi:hypothetical protein
LVAQELGLVEMLRKNVPENVAVTLGVELRDEVCSAIGHGPVS